MTRNSDSLLPPRSVPWARNYAAAGIAALSQPATPRNSPRHEARGGRLEADRQPAGPPDGAVGARNAIEFRYVS